MSNFYTGKTVMEAISDISTSNDTPKDNNIYEKKYKEALKWMQGLYSGLHGATKEEAEKYFPELKESEDKDEMIRQCLIEHIKYNKDLNWSLFQWFKPDTIIAWLEKQGENKSTEDKTELKESDDERIRREIIDFLRLPHPQFVGKRDHEKWIAWLEKNKRKFEESEMSITESQPEPKFQVGDKVTIKGDNTVYTIGIIAPDKTCWLKHESREHGWATFGVLKHYVE